MRMKVAGGTCESPVPSLWPLFPSPQPLWTGLLLRARLWPRSARAWYSLVPTFACLCLPFLLCSMRPSPSSIFYFPPGHCLLVPPPGSLPDPPLGPHNPAHLGLSLSISVCVPHPLNEPLNSSMPFRVLCVQLRARLRADVRLSSLVWAEPSP